MGSMSQAEAIEREAAIWLTRQDGDAWSTADAAAFQHWLNQSIEHEVSFYRLENSWRAADRLTALRGPDRSASETRSRSVWQPIAIAASLLVLCLSAALIYRAMDSGHPERFATLVGGHSTVPLADGSRVELNTDTVLRAEIADGHRRVRLERGEAFFDIAHDPTRPFEILAGRHRVIVVGTKFSVRRSGDDLQVNVLEGRVRIEPIEPAKTEAAPKLLTAGDQALVSGVNTLVMARSEERVAGALSWRGGTILFDQTRLIDAAAEFNRYNQKKLRVESVKLGRMTISGRFEADNVDAFVRLLRKAYGLEARETGQQVEIIE